MEVIGAGSKCLARLGIAHLQDTSPPPVTVAVPFVLLDPSFASNDLILESALTPRNDERAMGKTIVMHGGPSAAIAVTFRSRLLRARLVVVCPIPVVPRALPRCSLQIRSQVLLPPSFFGSRNQRGYPSQHCLIRLLVGSCSSHGPVYPACSPVSNHNIPQSETDVGIPGNAPPKDTVGDSLTPKMALFIA